MGAKTYIKIDTNHGISGWGEISQLEPKTAGALVTSMFELIDGENPTRIEYLWQKIYRAHRDLRGGPFMIHTLAGIDMALWDIAGKLWQTPVYRLMGGPTRDKIRVYPTPKAVKVPGHPARYSGNPNEIAGYVNAIENARKQVGPDGTVMFDAHCALPPPFLIQLAGALKASDVLFIEEPAVPGNIDVFKRLKEAIKIPLAAGERDRTIWEFLPYLENRCLDILQPDVAHGGGITAMRKVAILAETYFTPLAPHCTTTDLAVSASLHTIASVPMFLIHEYYPGITTPGLVKKAWSVDKDGYASLPQGPGLGVEIDEKVMEELVKKPQNKWNWPTHGRLEDGSISDY